MIVLDAFRQPIEHSIRNSVTQKQELESSGYFAYKMDDNGLRKAVNFKDNQLNAVDFFLIDENAVTLIELSDLAQDIIDCTKAENIFKTENIQTLAELLNKKSDKAINKAMKIVSKKIWAEIIAEFKNKWQGAIAVMERYARKAQYANDFEYQKFIIVLSNSTEAPELESFKLKCQNLSGMTGAVIVCRTKDLCYFLPNENKTASTL